MCLEEPMCKPAVPRCGHAGCFWCVHRAMDHFGASACPTCRQPFEHLPDVCVPLHRFLARAFPAEYARRLRETHEEEETKECFSPSPALDLDLGELIDKKEEDEKNASPLAFFDALEHAPAVIGVDDPKLHSLFLCGFQDDPLVESSLDEKKRRHALREPVVLTCGHAVCASCARSRLDFREDRFCDDGCVAPSEYLGRTSMRTRCPVCDARVVGNAPPTVCLPLHELTRAFASDDDDDAAAVTIEKSDSANANPERARVSVASSRSPPIEAETVERRPANGTLAERFLQVTGAMSPEAFVHHAVGCDGCGAYPIRGRRFACADCSSTAMGFDLCALCHESTRLDEGDETSDKNKNTPRGRFNQNHTKEHAMHEVTPVPTVMHFLTNMHPDLTPAQILDLAARGHRAEPEDGDAIGTEEAPTEERGRH